MFAKLLKRKAVVRAPEHPRVPDGDIVWAVGDIHGRLDLLRPLVEAIRADAEASDAQRKTVIFLGDYIDRGPDSRGVLRFLADLPDKEGIEWRFLMGNHEETMLKFLEDSSVGPRWCEFGGDAALRSYGLCLPQVRHQAAGWAHISADLDHRLGQRERAFLDSLELSISIGDYFFAHAGVRPGNDLSRQAPHDLMWIRQTFLNSDIEFEKVVVHGHTPTEAVYVDRRRIGLDTKAYVSGVLTAVRLVQQHQTVFQTQSETCEGGRPTIRVTSSVLRAFSDQSASYPAAAK